METTTFFICLGVSALGFFGFGFRLGFFGTMLAAVQPGKVCFSCVTVKSYGNRLTNNTGEGGSIRINMYILTLISSLLIGLGDIENSTLQLFQQRTLQLLTIYHIL